jgi:hypothetical protein
VFCAAAESALTLAGILNSGLARGRLNDDGWPQAFLG